MSRTDAHAPFAVRMLRGEVAHYAVHLCADDPALMIEQPFRMPVQWVSRPNQDFRGFAGRISGGAIAPGDAVRVLPSGRNAKIARVVTAADVSITIRFLFDDSTYCDYISTAQRVGP